ncbi:chromate transporter [Leptospira kirschneri]|uniref:chromate transporter n=1 Tax=Leptospira kirschneri TaxID=29507 RepID=UPI0009E4076D|nr:chromate transporter [Leptospira kirschneri]
MIPSFGETIRFWFRLGWFSFGGPAGQINLMYQTLVEEKKWIDEDQFRHALNYCMFLPGPEAQQLATYLGWILHGTAGGIFAGLFFILPSVFIFIGISIFYFYYGSASLVILFFNGVKPAILSVIFMAFTNLVFKSIKSNGQIFCFLLTSIGILFFSIPYPYLLLFAMFCGFVSFYFNKNNVTLLQHFSFLSNFITRFFRKFTWIGQHFFSPKDNNSQKISFKLKQDPCLKKYENTTSLEKIDLQTNLKIKHLEYFEILKQLSRAITIGLILWTLPILWILLFLKKEFLFWKELILFFSKTALITFGGAYAILPSVADFATHQAHWISANEMIDSIAFGESTPGPLVMVLTFVGFLAGANRFGSISYGLLGLLLTAYYTFLPSFILILGGASIVEKSKESDLLKSTFSYVSVCVCGVIFYLTIFFAKSILIEPSTDWELWIQHPLTQTKCFPFFWTVLGVLFLKLKKEYSIFWIFFSGIFFLGIDLIFHL